MSLKFNVLPAIHDHFETFSDHQAGGRPLVRDYAGMLGLPILAAGAIWFVGIRVREVGTFLGGIAILTGLLFALVIFVFQLRLQVSGDPRHPNGSRLPVLLDELFANVNYAVIIGMATSAVGVVAAATSDSASGEAPLWASVVLTALGVHLLLTVLMCVKRTRAAYRRMTR